MDLVIRAQLSSANWRSMCFCRPNFQAGKCSRVGVPSGLEISRRGEVNAVIVSDAIDAVLRDFHVEIDSAVLIFGCQEMHFTVFRSGFATFAPFGN